MRLRGLKHVESFAACVIVEIIDYGDFAYRYDLSRIVDVSVLTNVVVGAKFGTNVFGDVTAVETTDACFTAKLPR